jgi:hypothetical protein
VLVALGLAAASALGVGVFAGSLIAQDKLVQQSVASLPAAQRTYRVDSFGLPTGMSYGAADRLARSALARLSPAQPLVITSFRTLVVGGELVRLAGVDNLSHLIRLISGRLPRTCTADRCEVVQIGQGGAAVLSASGIRLVRVGYARVLDRGAFGESLSTSSSVAQPERPSLLLAAGAASFERLAAFQELYRTYSWIVPLQSSELHIWQVSSIIDRESQIQDDLAAKGDTFQFTGPDSSLLGAQQQAGVAQSRMLLVGGEIAAVLLGFAFVAATGLRRGAANETRRLYQRGARRSQVWLALTAEVGCMTLAGMALGVALGIAAVAAAGGAGGYPGFAIVDHSLWSFRAAGVALAVWLVSSTLIVAVVASRERRRSRVRFIDIAALGAAGSVGLGLASRSSGTAAVSSPAADRLLFALLPGLTCFVAAVVASRLLIPAMRLGERATRSSSATLRLAFVALARAPARTVATVGFLIVSIGLALFASSYRATLQAGSRDEAAYAVPLDFTLTEGPRLILPLAAAPLQRYDALAPETRAYPVLRRTANLPGAGTSLLSPTVLGLPGGALARLHWRSDYSKLSLASILRRLEADGPASLRGLTLPRATSSLRLDIAVHGVPVELDAVVENASGGLVDFPLGERPAGSWRLEAPVPRGARLLVALEVSHQALDAFGTTHREAEGPSAVVPAGSLTLTPLQVTSEGQTRVLTNWRGWLGREGGTLTVAARRPAHLSYAFTSGQAIVVRLPQVTDRLPLPVLVSPNIAAAAAANGAIVLNFQDAEIPARIVAVATRFPASDDLGQGFVVADESRLATALSADAPGTATPDELWVSVPGAAETQVARALRRAPFTSLELASREAIQHQLSAQPLARGITLTLSAAALLTIALAAIGLWVSLLSETRDERGELFDLEAQGLSPARLRAQLRIRTFSLLAFGVAGGVVLGLLLSRTVVSIVSISAETTLPDPPLLVQPAWATAAAGLGVLCLAVAALTEMTLRTALEGDTPTRASWSLE